MKDIKKILLLIVATFMIAFNVKADTTLQSIIDTKKEEIVLDKDYTEDITINENQNLTIDLNGYTLTSTIDVLGNLTLKTSKEGGKLVKGVNHQAAIYVGDATQNIAGKFTLENGEIISNNGTISYGIACTSGSTVIINGGKITSLDASLSGNNTLGNMNFIINGGELTAKKGPAIYMPGPVALTITDGIFNGGVSLRMGKINISGGTFNAIQENIDFVKDNYDYPGNVWFEDTLYVIGGTYTSKSETDSNILDMNITGGTFNNTNTYGSAIAIYDMGKVAQEMNITISGNTKLITNSKTRNAYDVLTLTEAGVTNIKKEYNNPLFVGKVKTTINGGTYSTSVKKYLTDEYFETKLNDEFIVAKKEVTIKPPVIDPTKPVDEVSIGVKETESLTDVINKALEKSSIDVSDKNASVLIIINQEKEENIPSDATKSINELIKDNMKIASFFDITLAVKNNISGETLGNLTELSQKISFNIALPENLTKIEEGYTRKYFIVRYHEGKSEIIPAEVDGNTLSFASDKFSTYALIYQDEKEEQIINPPTSDTVIIDLIVGFASISGLLLISNNIKNRKRNLSR